MSSAWTERQGQIGSLQDKKKEELVEILRRQEKLLSNKKFIQSLPDKGKKIKEFVERLHVTIARHEETEKRQGMLAAVRTEFQSKYQQALTQRQPGSNDSELETPHRNREHDLKHPENVQSVEPSLPNQNDVEAGGLKSSLDGPASIAAGMEITVDAGDLRESERNIERDLTEAFERVTLSADPSDSGFSSKCSSSEKVSDNPFWGMQMLKKPHYIEVIEKTQTNVSTRKPKFKPNQTIKNTSGSPDGSLSLGHSPRGEHQLSAEARRRRDMKHLDDVTAARLPPLHHGPVQLLSLEESAVLLREQTRKHEETQARLAAQKLSERLITTVGTYSPEGENLGSYREARDVGDQSSEED